MNTREMFKQFYIDSGAWGKYFNKHLSKNGVSPETAERLYFALDDGKFTADLEEKYQYFLKSVEELSEYIPPIFTKPKPSSEEPINLVTSRFKPLNILYHYGDFVIAEGVWDNLTIGLACRHHAPYDIGYPNGHGRPQWFELKGLISSNIIDRSKLINGRYKQVLTVDFESYVDSPYILDYYDVMIKVLNHFGHKRGSGLNTDNMVFNEDGNIVLENVNLSEISFFTPFALAMTNEDDEVYHYSSQTLFPNDGMMPQFKIICKLPSGADYQMYYDLTYPTITITYTDYVKMGFTKLTLV